MSIGNAAGVKAGEAFIEFSIENSKFAKQLKIAKGLVRRWADEVKAFFPRMLGGATALSSVLIPFLKTAVTADKVWRRFSSQFGKSTDAMTKRINTMRAATGLNITTLRQMSAQMGTLFAGMRNQVGEAGFRALTVRATEASARLAAVQGLKPQEAMQIMRSVLVDSGEAADKYGILVKEASLQQFALERGLNKSVRTMSEYEKMILKMEKATSDLNAQNAKLSEFNQTLSGQFVLLGQNLRDYAEAGGMLLVTVLKPIVGVMNSILGVLRPFSAMIGGPIVVAGVLGALGAVTMLATMLLPMIVKGFLQLVFAMSILSRLMGPLLKILKLMASGKVLAGLTKLGKMSAASFMGGPIGMGLAAVAGTFGMGQVAAWIIQAGMAKKNVANRFFEPNVAARFSDPRKRAQEQALWAIGQAYHTNYSRAPQIMSPNELYAESQRRARKAAVKASLGRIVGTAGGFSPLVGQKSMAVGAASKKTIGDLMGFFENLKQGNALRVTQQM